MKPFVLLSILAAAVSAVPANITVPKGTVPANLPDGGYAIELDQHGNEVYMPLPALPLSRSIRGTDYKNLAARAPLPRGEIGCDGVGINPTDLAVAQSLMYNYCGNSAPINPNKMVFQSGNAKVYTCNYGGPNTCAYFEAQAAFDLLKGNCGNPSAPIGGFYWIPDWAKNYGYANYDSPFCTNL